MKRFVSAVAGLFALGWSGMALADATTIATSCPPANFTCAFSAAETMSLVTPRSAGTPGQPDVYIGYMFFDGSGNVTITGTENVNGIVGQIGTVPKGSSIPVLSGSCAAGANGQPATVTLSDGQGEISFVTDSTGTELQFILSKDQNTTTAKSPTNSVRVGVCRKQ